ncbi:MAG: hypothetical protein ACYSTG_04260 [Planctomycetota bacterium]
MRRLAVILAAMALITAVPIGAVAANPDIGGDAVHEEEVYFSAGDWGMLTSSKGFPDLTRVKYCLCIYSNPPVPLG